MDGAWTHDPRDATAISAAFDNSNVDPSASYVSSKSRSGSSCTPFAFRSGPGLYGTVLCCTVCRPCRFERAAGRVATMTAVGPRSTTARFGRAMGSDADAEA